VSQIESSSELIPPSLPRAPFTAPSRNRETILVVEDEAFVREAMCKTLVFQGYRVLKAGLAAEARIMFRRCRQTVSLLLTDVVLPDKNGSVLAQELREICPDLKAVLVSGYPNLGMRQSGAQEGVFYLPKPFSAESLLQTVRQALAQKIDEIAI